MTLIPNILFHCLINFDFAAVGGRGFNEHMINYIIPNLFHRVQEYKCDILYLSKDTMWLDYFYRYTIIDDLDINSQIYYPQSLFMSKLDSLWNSGQPSVYQINYLNAFKELIRRIKIPIKMEYLDHNIYYKKIDDIKLFDWKTQNYTYNEIQREINQPLCRSEILLKLKDKVNDYIMVKGESMIW